jgi:FHS family glucose/mannose:H+ symporter-like MFS transporter
MSNSAKARLTVGGFLSFFVFGFVDNLKGPVLPELLRAENFSYSQGGTLMLAAYFGFILATLLTGFMADRVSNRGVLLLASVCLGVGLIGISLTQAYAFLLICMGAMGIGLGAIEVGGNGLMVELHSAARGRYLNLLATFHGIGSLLVPLYVARLIAAGFSWQQVYSSTAFLAALLTVVFAIGGRRVPSDVAVDSKWEWATLVRDGFNYRMGCYYLLIGSYVAVELGVAAWLVEYLQQVQGMSVTGSSLYLSAFFVMMMLGRFMGSFFVERIGYVRLVGVAISGGAICLSAGIFGPSTLCFALPLSGFFFSIVFPSVTAAVSGLHKANVGSILGILFTFAGLGGALGPWVIGLVSDWQGLKIGMASTLGFCLLSFIALGLLSAVPAPKQRYA